MDNIELSKIKDLSINIKGKKVKLKAMVSEIKELKTKQDKDYLRVVIQDSEGVMEFPIWDDFEQNKQKLEPGKIIGIVAVLDFYMKPNSAPQPQFNNFKYKVLDGENYKDYIPSFTVEPRIIREFERIIERMKEEKYKTFVKRAVGLDGVNKERWELFISAPAAQKHHHNKIGGLFLHTFGVLKAVLASVQNYTENAFLYSANEAVNVDRLIVCAILHDYKKTEEYAWQDGTIKRRDVLVDHLVLGVSYIKEINKELNYILDENDIDSICYSILSHHGAFGNYQPKTIEDKLLHCADMVDSQIAGAVEDHNTSNA